MFDGESRSGADVSRGKETGSQGKGLCACVPVCHLTADGPREKLFSEGSGLFFFFNGWSCHPCFCFLNRRKLYYSL